MSVTRRILGKYTKEQLTACQFKVPSSNGKHSIIVTAQEIVDYLALGQSRSTSSKHYNADKGSITESLTARMVAASGDETAKVTATVVEGLFDMDELVGRKTKTAAPKEPKSRATGVGRGNGGNRRTAFKVERISADSVVETVEAEPVAQDEAIEETVVETVEAEVEEAQVAGGIWAEVEEAQVAGGIWD